MPANFRLAVQVDAVVRGDFSSLAQAARKEIQSIQKALPKIGAPAATERVTGMRLGGEQALRGLEARGELTPAQAAAAQKAWKGFFHRNTKAAAEIGYKALYETLKEQGAAPRARGELLRSRRPASSQEETQRDQARAIAEAQVDTQAFAVLIHRALGEIDAYITATAQLKDAKLVLKNQVQKELLANEDYIAATAEAATLKAQENALRAHDPRFLGAAATRAVAGLQTRAAVAASTATDPFAAGARSTLLIANRWGRVASEELAATRGLTQANHALRIVRLNERIAAAELAGKTGEVARLQGILARATLRLANDTAEAARTTEGYDDELQRAGRVTAQAAEVRAEGRRTVTDRPEALRAAAARSVRLQQFELEDPELRALTQQRKSIRRQLSLLDKRQLVETEHGLRLLQEIALVDARIAEERGRVRDQFRDRPAARLYTAAREVGRAQFERDSPELRRLERERVNVRRQITIADRAHLLSTEEGVALIRRQARLDAEISAIRAEERDAFKQELAAQKRAGGPRPGVFERLQEGLSGQQGFGASLARRFLVTSQFATAGLTFRSVVQGISSVISEAENLQRVFALIRAQFASIGQAGDFPRFRAAMLGIARNSGIAADQVAHVGFQIKGVFGANTQRAVDETGAAIRAALVTGLPLDEIVDSLTAASLAFGVSIDTITDKAIGLEERFGVLSSESIKFFGDVSDTANAVGLDIDQLGTTLGVLQRNLGVSGGALSEQFSRLLGSVTENTPKILEIFTRYPQLVGQLPNLQTAISKGAGAAFYELAANFDKLNASTQESIAYQIGGQRQFRTTLTGLRGLNEEILKGRVYVDDHGKAIQRELDLQRTFGQQMARLREQVRQFGDALVETGLGAFLAGTFQGVRGILDILTSVLHVITSLNKLSRGWLGTFLGLVSAAIGLRVALKGLQAATLVFSGAQAGPGGTRGVAGALGSLLGFGPRREPGGTVSPPPQRVGSFLRQRFRPSTGIEGAAVGSGLKGALGGSIAAVLGSPWFAVGTIAVTALAAYSEQRKGEAEAQLKSFQETLKTDASKLDEKDRTKVEAETRRIRTLAAHTDTLGEKLKLGGEAIFGGLKRVVTLGRGSVVLHTESYQARRALADQQRAEQAPALRAQLDALERVGVLRLSQHFKSVEDMQATLDLVDAGDEEATQKILDILLGKDSTPGHPGGALGRLRRNPEARGRFGPILQDLLAAGERDKAVEEVAKSIEQATAEFDSGRMAAEDYIANLQTQRQTLLGQVAAFKRIGDVVPPEIQKALDDITKMINDAQQSVRDVGLHVAQAAITLLKARTQDPRAQARYDVQSARAAVDKARDDYLAAQRVRIQTDIEAAAPPPAAVAGPGPDVASAAAKLMQDRKAEEDRLRRRVDDATKKVAGLQKDTPHQALAARQQEKRLEAAAKEKLAATDALAAFLQTPAPRLPKAPPPTPPPPPKDPKNLTLDEKEKWAKYQEELAAQAQAEFAEQRQADLDEDSRIALRRAREGRGDNALENARRAKQDAQLAQERAKQEQLGVAAENQAAIAEIEADRSIERAMFDISQSRLKLLEAVARAAGRDSEAARLSVQEVQDELDRQVREDPTDEKAINDLKAQLVAQKDQAAATRVSETKDMIDFQLEMHEITVGQAIAQLRALLASPDVQANEDRVREIRRAIKGLQDQVSGALQFNIGDIKLPTLYEVRRTRQSAALGIGYNDNRVVTVTMNNYNATDYQGAVDRFVDVVNQPSRYGTQPSLYPSRN
jgi:hypothetical protein